MKLDFRRMSMAEIAYLLKGLARELESRDSGRGGRGGRQGGGGGYPTTSANPQYSSGGGGNYYGGQPQGNFNPRYQQRGGGYQRGGGPGAGGHRGFRDRRQHSSIPQDALPRDEQPSSNDGNSGENS